MSEEIIYKIKKELTKPSASQKNLFEKCLNQADGNKERAKQYYLHQRLSESKPSKPRNLDQQEKWPMLKPLLILYTLGTIGVLALVFGYLALQLDWL
jgi:hypothetical protein